MKRFGVWTLVFLIAIGIVDFGYIKPGFAQFGGIDFGVQISGASGWRARGNVYLVTWDWTAPATGPVTFAADGSFDIRLTIHGKTIPLVVSNIDDADGSRLAEVRFVAQQGQAYSISTFRDDGSFDPGTIVLHWSQVLPGDPGTACDPFLVCGTSITCVDGLEYLTTCGPENCDLPIGPCIGDPGPACDPSLICGMAITCVDGLEYPTTCGPENCDLSIVPCVTGGPVGGVGAGSDSFSSRSGISGASGQSKGSSIGAGKESGEPNHAGNSGGASVWWTWMAPATGLATFYTRGSNFDTLLTIYTGTSVNRLIEVASNDDASDGTLQSAVRFSAQQGQAYHIAVDGYGGKSGTIVLNWQAPSPSSGSDDFSPSVSLSSASGWSEGSNVGAGIESGEPNHAGNSGGASVWWTWTAPTTDFFTFHTRGSDIDTLLAVYTGDSLGNLVEVVSNDDDAEGGTLRSVVRFSAQQGQTYHIAVDGYGGATGTIVLNWQTSASVASLPVEF